MRLVISSAALAALLSFTLTTTAGNVQTVHPSFNDCPVDCDITKRSPWSVYNNVKRLEACDRRMMLDFALHNPLDDPTTTVKLRACTVPENGDFGFTSRSELSTRDTNMTLCIEDASPIDVSLDVAMSGDGSNLTWVTADALASVSTYMSNNCGLQQTFSYGEGAIVGVYSGAAVDNGGTVPAVLAKAIALANNSDTGAPETMFVQRCVKEGSSLHIFGVAVTNSNNLTWVQQAVSSWSNGVCLNASSLAAAEKSVVPNVTFYEYTHPTPVLTNLTDPGSNSTSSSSAIGSSTFSATSTSTSTAVKPPGPTLTGIPSNCNAYYLVQSGDSCATVESKFGITDDQFHKWNPAISKDCSTNFWANEAYCVGVSSSTKRDAAPAKAVRPVSYQLGKRGDCSTVTVAAGDSCGSLATECGITPAQFTKYNSDPSLCSSLTPGQRVCCSSGTLPDVTPKPNANGTCHAYTVVTGDSCSSLSAAYGLTNAKIEKFNNGTTWGWFGCNNLLADLKICLSTGDPPMPNSVANAECGPTVPGTQAPTNGTSISDLNPCPLNACCDIWGQCGITPAYCLNKTGPSGNPGTAPPGKNGCISNCGTKITGNDSPPSDFISVGYYETWNFDRPCLNMRAQSLETSNYTHVHWAFASISSTFDVVINDTYGQWNDFKALPVKRIVSFGGWGYSTSPDTYNQLRLAMNPDNRVNFANNVVKFLNDEGIDGVDFDWEYPGAPDIPGIPAGLDSDGPNYLSFLKTLRDKLGSNQAKTVSFAAPASYWYLKHFPIADMAKAADYIVYMTYDLHGQWDYGNKWSQDGCLTGNCLRSHINLTETYFTLAMITKAKVPTSKIVVGVSSYGRSFGMTDANCKGPNCFFGGSSTKSTASPGECTQTGGYISNAEINEMIESNDTSLAISSWYDHDTDSNYLVYNKTNWVSYMTDEVKASRANTWKGLNFAGTIDWAADLAYFGDDDNNPSGNCTDCDDEKPPKNPFTPCKSDPTVSLDQISDDVINSWPVHCRAQYTLEALSKLLNEATTNYTNIMNDGYDKKFKVYAKAVAKSASQQVHDFLLAHGNEYFTCTVTEFEMCCDYCTGGKDQCRYCFDGSCYTHKRDEIEDTSPALSPPFDDFGELMARGDYYPQNNKKLITKWVNKTEPCPPDYSLRGYGPSTPYDQTIFWNLEQDKSDAFFADLLNATGIPSDKIEFGLYTDVNECSGMGHKMGDGADCWNNGYEFGAPVPTHYGADDVANPKAVADKGLHNSANLPKQLNDLINSMKGLSYPGDAYQVIDAVSLPIMMIAQGVESMSLVIQTAEKIEEEERKALILAFISAILFFVPIAGEIAGAVAELGDLATILSIMGAVGNAAMDVYTVVDDPKNAPLAIVDLIMSPLALADVSVIAKASNIKRGMKAEDMSKLGARVGERMAKVEKVTGVCTK